ncbi:deacetylase sulfotransferase [Phycicoccus endophyticus]|nr:deacetylase sulfotransferase [Phycicoccus endophyticus]
MSRQGEHVGTAPTPLRTRAPARVRVAGRRLATQVGTATAGLRVRPDFVLAGAQRCGTTSLFRALMAHPQVVRPSFHKGVNYFDVNYERGPAWYGGHFPLRSAVSVRTARAGGPCVFEASGYYLYHPLAIERLVRELPQVKVVVMLRDPVERAFSAWKHESARGFETESFERALELEPERLAGEEERIRSDPAYQSFAHRHQSYLHRGHYADQLDRASAVLPREQLHVIESADFFGEPEGTFLELTDFLGISRTLPPHFDRYNARPGDMDPATRLRLGEYFAPHDARLEAYLRGVPSWRDAAGA